MKRGGNVDETGGGWSDNGLGGWAIFGEGMGPIWEGEGPHPRPLGLRHEIE